MVKYFFWVVIIIIVVFGGTFGMHHVINKKIAQTLSERETRPVISTTTVKQADYQPMLTAVGSVTAIQGIDITSQINGQIIAIPFTSDTTVSKGQLLVQLDQQLAQQQYDAGVATLNYDKANYERQKTLLKQQAISQNLVDQAKATYLAQKAQVGINKVNLDYTSIRAPFAGTIGIRQVNIGQYITPSTPIASLQQMDPIFVEFPMPSADIAKLYKGQTAQVTLSSQANKIFTGKITAIDSVISEQTRTVNVRAQFDNPKELLTPGQFANVSVLLDKQEDVLEIPRSAVSYSLYGDQVYVVTTNTSDSGDKQYTVTATMVKLGPIDGDNVIIEDGLKVSDVVVNAGQNKLQSGQEVLINNSVSLN